jgi:hypothetical protein
MKMSKTYILHKRYNEFLTYFKQTNTIQYHINFSYYSIPHIIHKLKRYISVALNNDVRGNMCVCVCACMHACTYEHNFLLYCEKCWSLTYGIDVRRYTNIHNSLAAFQKETPFPCNSKYQPNMRKKCN